MIWLNKLWKSKAQNLDFTKTTAFKNSGILAGGGCVYMCVCGGGVLRMAFWFDQTTIVSRVVNSSMLSAKLQAKWEAGTPKTIWMDL